MRLYVIGCCLFICQIYPTTSGISRWRTIDTPPFHVAQADKYMTENFLPTGKAKHRILFFVDNQNSLAYTQPSMLCT